MSLAQIGEFAFVLLSRASNLHLVEASSIPLLFQLSCSMRHFEWFLLFGWADG